MNKALIEAREVTRVFSSPRGEVDAVRNLSLDVHKGEAYASSGHPVA